MMMGPLDDRYGVDLNVAQLLNNLCDAFFARRQIPSAIKPLTPDG